MWLYSVWFRMYLYVMLFYVHTRIKDVSSVNVSVVRRGVESNPKQDAFPRLFDSGSCDGYGAYNYPPRQCQCDNSKSTFLFKDQECVENKEVRRRVLSDCTNIIRFTGGDGEQSPLNVFDLANVSSKKPILDVRRMTGECIVKPQCLNEYDGSLSSKPNAFSIDINDKTLSWQGSNHYNGRILRLQLENCTATRDSSTFTNPCIALKAKGMSIYPSRASSIGSTTSSKITPSSSVLPEPTTSIYPLNPKDKSGNQKDEANGTVIGITVACVLVFVGLFVLVVIMIYRRKSRAHSNGIAENSSRPRDTVNNPMYGKKGSEVIGLKAKNKKSKPGFRQQEQSDVNNEDYDYAAVDGVQVHTTTNNQPVYQSLDRKNVPPKENSSRNSDAGREKYPYNHLQHPTYEPPHSKDVPSDPVYQPLETPSTGNGADREQYSYNHLQHPTHEPPHSKDVPSDPAYQPLETPSKVYEPLDGTAQSIYQSLGPKDSTA